MKEKITNSIQGVIQWVESHDYKAYDPGDGNCSYLHGLTFDIIFSGASSTAGGLSGAL